MACHPFRKFCLKTPNSPDFALSEYHQSRSMQHSWAEKNFENRNKIQILASNFFESPPAEFLKDDTRFLRGCCRQVTDKDREYILF